MDLTGNERSCFETATDISEPTVRKLILCVHNVKQISRTPKARAFNCMEWVTYTATARPARFAPQQGFLMQGVRNTTQQDKARPQGLFIWCATTFGIWIIPLQFVLEASCTAAMHLSCPARDTQPNIILD